MKVKLKTLRYRKETVLIEVHVNRDSKILDHKIYLFRCYEHGDPNNCNTTVYLSNNYHMCRNNITSFNYPLLLISISLNLSYTHGNYKLI